MPLSRRTLLATAAAGLMVRVGSAFAATPVTTFRNGAFDVTVVSDGYLQLPTSFLAPGAPQEERDRLLKEAEQTREQYQSPTNITLLRTANDLILIDMGSGDRFMPSAGKLWDNLKTAGIDKSKVTKVVFTHGHPDHLWGTIDELDDLMLPNASFYVGATEWDFWQSDNATSGLPAERAGFVTGARRNYAAIKSRVTMLKPGDDIVTGLRAIATPGHTQGHLSLEVAGDDGLVIAGDALTHTLISFRHPDWKPTADHVPDQAAATRRSLLDRITNDRSRVIGFHFPYPGIGRAERKDAAYRFVAES